MGSNSDFDQELLCCGLCGLPSCECCRGVCDRCSWALDLGVDARTIAELIDDINDPRDWVE